MIPKRSDAYRYTVDLMNAEITPLASVEAFVGPEQVRVLNISAGGIALIFDHEAQFTPGDIMNISVAIRERHFPVQVEVKGVRGKRLSCAFLSPQPAFTAALQEYLQPKFLGDSLQRSGSASDRLGALELVEGARVHEAYLGSNQTAFFVWLGDENAVLKLVGRSRDIVFEWSPEAGLQTGRLQNQEDVAWDREPSETVLHYFADILIAWFNSEDGTKLVNHMFTNSERAAWPLRAAR